MANACLNWVAMNLIVPRATQQVPRAELDSPPKENRRGSAPEAPLRPGAFFKALCGTNQIQLPNRLSHEPITTRSASGDASEVSPRTQGWRPTHAEGAQASIGSPERLAIPTEICKGGNV